MRKENCSKDKAIFLSANMTTLTQIKDLRARTGAGIVDVKKALEEAEGDEKKAIDILRRGGHDKAAKKAGREVHEGVIAAYVHSNKKIGAMVTLLCETDFVARTEDFQTLAYDIAMHVAATDPQFLRPEDVSEELITKEKKIWKAQLVSGGKPDHIHEKILSGKEKKFREEISLTTQPFVKDPERTIADLLREKIATVGENIHIGAFTRFEI